MKNGTKGCDKADSCEYLHPDMCKKSLEGAKCVAKRCFLGHIQGTREFVAESSSSPPKENQRSQSNFRKASKKGHTP